MYEGVAPMVETKLSKFCSKACMAGWLLPLGLPGELISW